MPDREKVIKGMEQFRADFKPFFGNHADWERFDAGLSMLKEQESIIKTLKSDLKETLDVVENRGNVVRCKDCKKHNTWECWQYFFGRMNLPDDYYCADAEPKDGDQE